MKIPVAFAALLIASPALAQTAPATARPGNDLTRSLNAAPASTQPVIAPVLTPTRAIPPPIATPAARPANADAPPAMWIPTSTPAPSPEPATVPASDVTRSLNASPPGRVVPSAPAVSTPVAPPTPVPTPAPTPSSAAARTLPPASAPAAAAARPTSMPTPPAARPVVPVPTPAARPATTLPPAIPVRPSPPVATPPPAPVEAAVEPAGPPRVTALDAAAIAALPFTVELPPGFRIDAGRPGADFNVYRISRGERPFVMIYAGPTSQFPIYTGDMVRVAGRASVVSVEDGQRHALEHLFQRSSAPQEVHVWVSSVEGADRVVAERIAQSVDVR